MPYRSLSGLPKLEESVHSPLPYGYIDELRQMIASGKDFKDWEWAQQALGAEFGADGGRVATDWFPVTQDQIDENDPDCVWYLHQRAQQNGGPVIKMWSPVRWVALLVKLIIPLRTYQVRMLDSGEADTWRYESGNWVRNESAFAERNERRPLQQGVFRRPNPRGGDVSVPALLYINTNKTADIGKSGSEKGYILPWICDAPLHQNLFYWIEKLRNWQGKYNPVSRRTAWNEMDGRHLEPKSDVQLASYPDACFLFRLAEDKRAARQIPSRQGGKGRGSGGEEVVRFARFIGGV